MVFLIEMPKSIACDSKQRMRALDGAHEHIGVYEDFHLLAVWIEIFAAQRLVGNRGSLRETVRPLFKLAHPFLGAQAASGNLGSVKG